ncbi:MAG: tyrosine-type recombinase/integrase [Actinomycetota bacterium]|nr:tyrosine-type recombinase/integrase [Actinomycetota bacterium]MDA8074768.1 tyrosine-type recombinase/integrase [Actinomycetota bacterium]
MPPAPMAVPAEAVDLYEAYLEWLARRGVGNRTFYSGARSFLGRFPDPQAWAGLPLADRIGSATSQIRPLVSFLMLHGHLRPGYDYLLERRLHSVLRDGAVSPLGGDLARFLAGAEALGYSERSRTGMASEVAARLLIQTGRPLGAIDNDDVAVFKTAIIEREARDRRPYKHYHQVLYASSAVIYHLGAPAEPTAKHAMPGRWSWERHLDGIDDALRASIVAYLERCSATLARSTVSGTASELAHFGRYLAVHHPELTSFADLDRRRHVEPYLSAVANSVNHRTGEPVAISTRRSRVQAVGRMLEAMAEWGWDEAPTRRLVFERDSPRLPRPLPRYLPIDADRRLAEALEASPNRLRADALLLQRACGLRIGEVVDLELDCVHEVAGHGAWLKVPLGKLATERMVPLDEQTVELLDRIVEHRSPGRPLRHPRTGKLVDFLLTHHGRRVNVDTLRAELHRAATDAGLDDIVPHQLRHTFATALVNAGCSLQALMAMLGHTSAEMSLRYGRLFDSTVRADYDLALTLAKERLGPVMPEPTPVTLDTDWRAAPLIKARMAGGYCVRTLAQGACTYTNICEHCPNYRSNITFLPILLTQRADAAALAADAEERGWGDEAARHRRLIERIDTLIARTGTE